MLGWCGPEVSYAAVIGWVPGASRRAGSYDVGLVVWRRDETGKR